MCTVTIIPLSAGGFRLMTNRDESPARSGARTPEVFTLRSGAAAAWPIDPKAGGTWVAASDRGLVLTVLNLNEIDPLNPGSPPTIPAGERTSRGTLIPELIDSSGAHEAARALRRIDLSRTSPFRLVAVDGAEVAVCAWNGESLELSRHACQAMCLASSGLGDHRVVPRLVMFREMLREEPLAERWQERFHAHQWPDRPEISVMMRRDAARTVSVTRVTVGPHPNHPGRARVEMNYAGVLDGARGDVVIPVPEARTPAPGAAAERAAW